MPQPRLYYEGRGPAPWGEMLPHLSTYPVPGQEALTPALDAEWLLENEETWLSVGDSEMDPESIEAIWRDLNALEASVQPPLSTDYVAELVPHKQLLEWYDAFLTNPDTPEIIVLDILSRYSNAQRAGGDLEHALEWLKSERPFSNWVLHQLAHQASTFKRYRIRGGPLLMEAIAHRPEISDELALRLMDWALEGSHINPRVFIALAENPGASPETLLEITKAYMQWGADELLVLEDPRTGEYVISWGYGILRPPTHGYQLMKNKQVGLALLKRGDIPPEALEMLADYQLPQIGRNAEKILSEEYDIVLPQPREARVRLKLAEFLQEEGLEGPFYISEGNITQRIMRGQNFRRLLPPERERSIR